MWFPPQVINDLTALSLNSISSVLFIQDIINIRILCSNLEDDAAQPVRPQIKSCAEAAPVKICVQAAVEPAAVNFLCRKILSRTMSAVMEEHDSH